MAFVLRIDAADWLEIIGTPANSDTQEEYYRSGAFYIEGGWLRSLVFNEGNPIRLTLREGRLRLTIDETLTLEFAPSD